MQTFLPFDDFHKSAEVLDYRRLGKQRVEAKQILQILLGDSKGSGWKNHPAVLMWKGFEAALAWYGSIICAKWIQCGYKDQTRSYFSDYLDTLFVPLNGGDGSHLEIYVPPWLGNEEFHASHRSNLLRKDPEHYGQFGWKEPMDLPYVWPVRKS